MITATSTEFALVRHATCALTASTLLGRAIDAPLDARGQQQAQALARGLRCDSVALLCSPRLRAQQTASAIAARLHLPVIIASTLDEIDYGSWSGRCFTELQADPAWRDWNEHRNTACTPCGETMQQIQQRIVHYLEMLARQFAGWRVIVVTHAELIRAALLHYWRLDCDAYADVDISPASISTLEIGTDAVHVLRVNQHCACALQPQAEGQRRIGGAQP